MIELRGLHLGLQWGRSRLAPENIGIAWEDLTEDTLQWSRSRLAPENHVRQQIEQVALAASMEPEPVGSGKHLKNSGKMLVAETLQWSRSRLAPENRKEMVDAFGGVMLQWSRSRLAPENLELYPSSPICFALQWSRSRLAPENIFPAFPKACRTYASMEPEPVGSGKQLSRQPGHSKP